MDPRPPISSVAGTRPQQPHLSLQTATTAPCPACGGSGEDRMYTGGRLADYWVGPCRRCNGAGAVAIRIVIA